MLTTSLISAILGLFGKKAKFIVTPKTSNKINLGYALLFQWKEFLFSSILLAVSLIFSKSPFPVILIIITGYLSFFLLFFSNKKYSEKQTKEIDRKTTMVSLKINTTFAYTLKANKAVAVCGGESNVDLKSIAFQETIIRDLFDSESDFSNYGKKKSKTISCVDTNIACENIANKNIQTSDDLIKDDVVESQPSEILDSETERADTKECILNNSGKRKI